MKSRMPLNLNNMDIIQSVGNIVSDITDYFKLKQQEETIRTRIVEQAKTIRAEIDALREIALSAIDKNFTHRNQRYQELFAYQQTLLAQFDKAEDIESKNLVKQMIDVNMNIISQTIQGDSSFKGIDMPNINKLTNGEI